MIATHRYILVALGSGIVVGYAVFFWPRPEILMPPRQVDMCVTTSVAEQVAQADLILTGHVFAILPFQSQAEVLIVPERLYRGAIPSRGVNIVTEESSPSNANPTGSPRDPLFQTDQGFYFLWLQAREDGRYEVQPCTPTRLFNGSLTATELELLGPGQDVDAGPAGSIQ